MLFLCVCYLLRNSLACFGTDQLAENSSLLDLKETRAHKPTAPVVSHLLQDYLPKGKENTYIFI